MRSHLQFLKPRFRSSKALFLSRESLLPYRSAPSSISAGVGHVVSCMQSNTVSAAQRHYSRIARKYSPEVTTRHVVTPDYMVTTRFSRWKSKEKRSSDAMLATWKQPMQRLSGSEPRRACSARPAPFEPAFFYFGPVRAFGGCLRSRRSLCPRFGFFLLNVLLIGCCPHPVRGISRSL